MTATAAIRTRYTSRISVARGNRILVSSASTTGISASARNKLMPTRRTTPRIRQTRYSAIPQRDDDHHEPDDLAE